MILCPDPLSSFLFFMGWKEQVHINRNRNAETLYTLLAQSNISSPQGG
jgi:hypothetical protein